VYKKAAARLATWQGDDINALAREIYQILTSPIELVHDGQVTILGDVKMDGDVRSLRWATARFDAVIVPDATEKNGSYVDCWEATSRLGGVTDVPVRVYLPSTGANTECVFDPPAIEAGTVLAYQYDQRGVAISYTMSAMEPTLRVALANQDMMWGTLTDSGGPYSATLVAPDDNASPTYSTTTRTVNVYSACRNTVSSGEYILIQKEVCSKTNELWLLIGLCGDAAYPGGRSPPVEFNNSEMMLSEFN
jgi:hypothetical protein